MATIDLDSADARALTVAEIKKLFRDGHRVILNGFLCERDGELPRLALCEDGDGKPRNMNAPMMLVRHLDCDAGYSETGFRVMCPRCEPYGVVQLEMSKKDRTTTGYGRCCACAQVYEFTDIVRGRYVVEYVDGTFMEALARVTS